VKLVGGRAAVKTALLRPGRATITGYHPRLIAWHFEGKDFRCGAPGLLASRVVLESHDLGEAGREWVPMRGSKPSGLFWPAVLEGNQPREGRELGVQIRPAVAEAVTTFRNRFSLS